MTKEEVESKLDEFEKAVETFKIVLHFDDANDIEKDASIKRFEYCYESSWKTIKMFIEYKGGKEIKGSRDSFKEAYRFGLISGEKLWFDMMEDRNLTVHVYDMLTAHGIFNHLKPYCLAMIDLIENMKDQLKYD